MDHRERHSNGRIRSLPGGHERELLSGNHLGIKRFFALDTKAYEDGALDKRTKELLGLVASIVLRCDDCITYHIKQSVTAGVTRPEFLDAFNVALVVGGSITIPHLRRAVDRLDQTLEGNVDEIAPHALMRAGRPRSQEDVDRSIQRDRQRFQEGLPALRRASLAPLARGEYHQLPLF